MRFHHTLLLSTLLLAGLAATALPAAAQAPATTARQVITSGDQLPRRSVKLNKLPSYYLSAPRAEVLALADVLEKNLRSDLGTLDIRDAATQRSYLGSLLSLAQFRGDWAAVPGLVAQLKALQEKAGPRATTGVIATILAEQRLGGRDAAWVRAEVEKRYGALDWNVASETIKGTKSNLELLNPQLTQGAFEQQLDVMARNMKLEMPEDVIGSIIDARIQNELIVPVKGALTDGLQAVVDRHAVQAVAKPDVWTPSQFSIAPNAKATEVGVGIWDSGVDVKLFNTAAVPGMAMDADGHILGASNLLRPLGDAAPRWPELKQRIKGRMDLRAALDTPEARQLRKVVAGLKADQAKSFEEEGNLLGLYIHGTHVAGIAVAGNPFARVYAGTVLFDYKAEPRMPSEEHSRRVAASYRAMVDGFKQQKLRVVNMSWRYGANAYEGALTWHNIGTDAEDRKRLARQLFAIERDAMREAIAGAPEILFVAGAGNEDNSADFEEYIPAGLQLPNLITVGASDTAGDETSFSSFGNTVVVYANGFGVESFLPGGDRMKLSGTSMASPQVANLAAKLFALRPQLTVAQVKDAILKGAETHGRVRLANPRKTAELLGIVL